MPLPKVQIQYSDKSLTIRINNHVHLFIKGHVEGFMASIEQYYEIDFYRDKKQNIVTQYDKKELWLKVVKELEKKMIK